MLTMRMEQTEVDFDGAMALLFGFLLTATWRPAPPKGNWRKAAATSDSANAAVGGGDGNGAAPSLVAGGVAGGGVAGGGVRSATNNESLILEVARLVAASARFDVSRHRQALDDGHLSSLQRKRELRGMLLNESKLAAELRRYRETTGYDADYATHCSRYGFRHHFELRGDGVQVRRRRRRRRA